MADVKILRGLLQKSPQQLNITAGVHRSLLEAMLTRVLAVPDPIASASLIVQLLQVALRQVSSPDGDAGRRVMLAFVRSEREAHHAAVISALTAAPELAAVCLFTPQGNPNRTDSTLPHSLPPLRTGCLSVPPAAAADFSADSLPNRSMKWLL